MNGFFARGFEAGDVETWVEASFGVRVACACAAEPIPLASLSAAEAAELTQVPESRRLPWRLGRAALRSLFAGLGRNDEVSGLSFPHPSISLTHAGGLAVAVQRLDPSSATPAGIGVDVEPARQVAPAAARLFLSTRERARAAPRDWLRLWTIKEAAFKADLGQCGWSGNYVVADPRQDRGHVCHRRGAAFRYCSRAFEDGFLSVAIPAPLLRHQRGASNHDQ